MLEPTEPRSPGTTLHNIVSGVLHGFVAFDWGDEIDLDHARRLVPSEPGTLARRRRTPDSIRFRPAPLCFPLSSATMDFCRPAAEAEVEATVFDFGAVSLRWQAGFQLAPSEWSLLAASLADNAAIEAWGRRQLGGLYQRLEPALRRPLWSELSEEYLVFQFVPHAGIPDPGTLLTEHAAWLACLLRLENESLSDEEIAEALRLHLTYGQHDLFVPEWSAAVLCDQDCEETLQTIEFANLQLLEYRHIDDRLDEQLAEAYRTIKPLGQRRLPLWRTQARRLRGLGELRVEANGLFERTGNVLKLVGDQYLARVYRLLGARFHLEAWERSIASALDVVERVYQVVADQAAMFRTELLEIVVILLIAFEIAMAFFRH